MKKMKRLKFVLTLYIRKWKYSDCRKLCCRCLYRQECWEHYDD